MSNFFTDLAREYTGNQSKHDILFTNIQNGKGIRVMPEETKQQPEWITTRDAKTILKVTSTQGVWNVIERAKRYHEFELRKRNIGTEDMPRYLLNRQDVETVAELMGKVDD